MTVNGRAYERTVPVRLSLADFLRDHLHLTGTHLGCEHGVCGACTISLNGRSARSCLTLAVQADGCEIITIEGLRAEDGTRHPIQQLFLENFALQCGYCTPGFLITALELLRDNPKPTEHEVREALSGNLCRCSGYQAIVDAVLEAADKGLGLMSDTRFVNQRMVGSSVIPDEAIPLVEGDGRFLNDIKLPGMYHVAFLRSQHAHAKLNSIDVSEARKLPGVIKVLTGKELLGKVDPFRSMPNRFSGGELVQHWLAVDKVRFCGEAICAVVAEDRATAEDAFDLIKVDYEPLPVVTDPRLGELDDSPLVHDACPNNYLIKREYQRGPVDEAFQNAAAVVKRRFKIGRKQALCLEGRGCVAGYRENTFTLTMWISHQLPYVVRHYLAKHLRLAETDVRVIVPHTGGGFGQKASIYPEEFVCGWLALQLRRPVKWVEDRIENMVASTHARDQTIELEMAADKDGRILAISSDIWVDVGAYSTYLWSAGMEPLQTAGLMPGPYRIEAMRYRTRGVATNKTPVGPYRAVGRPSASASLELLIDEMARKLKLDPVEMRLRNLIPGEAMPYRNANNLVHDNVNYVPCLKLSVAKSEYERQRAEQLEPQANGKLRGVGVACFAELTGLGTSTAVGPGTLLQPGRDAATLRLETSGVLTIAAALPSQGQRIMTAMRQVASDELGIKLEDITSITNDTATAPYGFGTFASRTAVFGSGAVIKAARELAAAHPRHGRVHPAGAGRRTDHRQQRGADRRSREEHLAEGHGGEELLLREGHSAGAQPGLRGHGLLRSQVRQLRRRRPHRRGRRRSEDRPRRNPALRRRRGCRHRHQPGGGGGADHRRHRARHRRGAAGGAGLRRGRPAAHRDAWPIT